MWMRKIPGDQALRLPVIFRAESKKQMTLPFPILFRAIHHCNNILPQIRFSVDHKSHKFYRWSSHIDHKKQYKKLRFDQPIIWADDMPS